MRNLINILLVLFLFNSCGTNSKLEPKAKVSEGVELTSIIFRLAEAEEYKRDNVISYVEDIDLYFNKFKDHHIIAYVRDTLRDESKDEVAYDAVASFASSIELNDGSWILSDNNFSHLLKDPRWTENTLTEFVRLLNDFYKVTNFKEFFNKHTELYAETEKRYNEILSDINFNWFESFYGKALPYVPIYVSLCNGPSNYSLGDRGLIMGCQYTDENGIPSFTSQDIPVLIHEFSHLLTNPLVLPYLSEMKQDADSIFPYVKEKLLLAGYGHPDIMLQEGFNNLFVNMYFKENSDGFEDYYIRFDEEKGFVWMLNAVYFMGNFYSDRNSFPTINEFMPHLVSFISETSKNIDFIVKDNEQKYPKVLSVYPPLNSVVGSDTKEVWITFSRKMRGCYGVSYLDNDSIISPFAEFSLIGSIFDEITGRARTNDNRTLIFKLDKLEKGKKYGFILDKGVVQAADTYPMLEDFEVKFETTK